MVFYNSASMLPMIMKVFEHIEFMVEQNIKPVHSKIFTSFWEMGDLNSMILVGVGPHKAHIKKTAIG